MLLALLLASSIVSTLATGVMHLTETQMAIIQPLADQTPQAEEVRLFGSYAKGNAHAGSDVDLAGGQAPATALL